MLRSVSTVNGVTSEPLYAPAYRLAAARSTEHREQELAWQWHIYRIKQAKGKIDAKEPHCVNLRRDPRKSAKQLALHTANVFRAHEIQMANNALVSRIKGQKSTYGDLFDEELVAKNAARADRALAHRKEIIEMAGTSTSRTGKSGGGGGGGGGVAGSMTQGASGLYFNSRASKNNQHRIAQDNQSLLKRLKNINAGTGPYNSRKLQNEVAEHERLVRRRLPRIMHAHPNLASERVLKMQPPIHYSVEAARATSPSRSVVAGVSLSSPQRAPAGPVVPQQDEDWRVYAESRGLTPQSQQPRRNNGHSPARRSPQPRGNGSATTRPKTTATPTARASEEKSNDEPVQRRPLTANSQRTVDKLIVDELLDGVGRAPSAATKNVDDEDDASTASFAIHSAAPANAPGVDGVHLFGVSARTDETAAEKMALGRSFVHLTIDGCTPCTVFCEAAGNAPPGADVTGELTRTHTNAEWPRSINPLTFVFVAVRMFLSALQFTCFLDAPAASDSARSPSPDPLPLLLLISSLDRLLPSTLQSLVSSPYRDFTSLLYALRPRFTLQRDDDGRSQLKLELAENFVPRNNRTQQMKPQQKQALEEEIGEATTETDPAAKVASSAATPEAVAADDEHAAPIASA